MKTYKLKITRNSIYLPSNSSVSYVEGTLEELVKYFSYALEVGQSWETESGNKKINRNPKTIRSLITNVMNAKNNAARNGYGGYYVELVYQ
jgi:hypothetical protein